MNRIEFASYMLKDVVHIWHAQWKEIRDIDVIPITWDCFSETFFDRIFPIELREEKDQ